MKQLDLRLVFGALLVVAGTLSLLESLNIVRGATVWLWAIVLGVGGLAFLALFVGNREQWWALIPALSLLSVTALLVLTQLTPRGVDVWGGPIILGGIGLSFWLIYLIKRDYWWAIIPGGVLVTLAVVAGLGAADVGVTTGGVFFFGLGLTFVLVGVLPTPHGQMRWAFIPGGLLLVMGVLIVAAAESLFIYLLPVALIALGVFLVFRTFRPQKG
jgi:hypothetical protein